MTEVRTGAAAEPVRPAGVAFEPPAPLVRFTGWLRAASPWRVLAVAAVVRAATVGVWSTPNIDEWVALTRDPFGSPAIRPYFEYITGSPLGSLLGHALGITSAAPLALLHLAALIASAATLVAFGRRQVGDDLTKVAVVVLFASPLSNILLTWLGQPDVFTFGALSAVGLATCARTRGSRAAAAAGGLVLGFNAFEQAFLGLLALALVALPAGRRSDRGAIAWAAVAALVGRAIHGGYVALSDAPFQSRLEFLFDDGGVPSQPFIANLPTLVFSAFAGGWLLIAVLVHRLGRRDRDVFRGAVVAGFAGLGAALIVLDETRVVTLVLWAATLRLVTLALDRELGERDWLLVGATAFLGLIVPPIVLWDGTPYVTAWPRLLW